MDIEIVNWDKFNPKRDQSTYTWLRLNNDIATDPELFGLSAEQKFVWIEILCQASKKNRGTLTINIDQLSHITGVKPDKINQLLDFLTKKPIIKIHDRQGDRALPPIVAATTPTNVRTYETNETNIAPASPLPSENPVKEYCERYKAKYGHNPVIGKKQAGILVRFAKNHPNRWKELVRGYLEMPDSWAVQRSHPVEMLESKINEIVRFLETGKVVTKKVIEHAEEIIDRSQGTLRRPRRSIEELEAEQKQMRAEAQLQIVGSKK